MNIVANSFFLRNLRNLEFFTLNLGKTKKLVNNKDNKNTFRKLSEFEVKYKSLYGNSIMVFGSIGKVTFYEDLHMEKDRYLLFNNDDIYEIDWSDEDTVDFKNYILETMRKVDEIDNDEEQHGIDDYDEFWEAKDEKNNNKKYLLNQNLPREEYREQLLKLKENNEIKKN